MNIEKEYIICVFLYIKRVYRTYQAPLFFIFCIIFVGFKKKSLDRVRQPSIVHACSPGSESVLCCCTATASDCRDCRTDCRVRSS